MLPIRPCVVDNRWVSRMTLKKAGLALLLVLGFQAAASAGPVTTTTQTATTTSTNTSVDLVNCVAALCGSNWQCVTYMTAYLLSLSPAQLSNQCNTTTPISTGLEEDQDVTTSGDGR